MPPRGKKRTTQSSTSSTKKKSSNLAAKLFAEQEDKRKRQDDEIFELIESSYGTYKNNNGENFDDFCDLMRNALIRKKRKHENEIVPVLVKNLPQEIVAYSIIPFMDLESVLSGGVFMVCRAWYEGMINEERMWQELFGRLWNLTIEESNLWKRWPTEFNTNDGFLREINRTTRFTTKPTKLKISGDQMVKKHSYKFFKEFCLSKYSSFRKHAKIGGVKGFFLTTHQESSYADSTVIEPSLYSRFHITSVEDKLKYISVTNDGDMNNTTATIHVTLEYYTAQVPFSMKIDVSYSVMYEEQESSISISARKLPIANSNTQTKLILMNTGEEDYSEEEEESEESPNQDNAISTFKTEWVGNTFADITEQSAQRWLYKFVSTLGIDLLDEALYRMNDR